MPEKKISGKGRKGKRLFIVMPAYNEEKAIAGVIRSLKHSGYNNIIVVDDGSRDKTSAIAEKEGVILIRHFINRGLGGALGTGISAALKMGAEIIVTFDSDGQHDVSDIKKVAAPIRRGEADVAIGSRLVNSKGMPFVRRVGNWGLNFFTYLLFGVFVTDSQSGLRAFSKNAAEKMDIRTNAMEVSSEIIREIGDKKLRLKEVPIKAIYSEYSLRKGQSTINGFRIMMKLFINWWMR
ncbi:MAG: glycosyltransferase family 2 protein [Candidatus Woesearchaeota archaeon]|nr:glycosyltransferase family 2 protein [Candidatus Woesearchaeota archaeon]